MTGRTQQFAVMAIALMLAVPGAAIASGEEIPWTEKISGALKDSASSGKPVFIDVWATWCVPCKEMDDTTYRHPRIVEAMLGFVPLKVDQDSSEMFCERHAVEGLPLVLYLDGEGREIGRRMGLQKTDELLPSMKAVEAGYADYIAAMEHPKDPEAAGAVAAYLTEAGNPSGAVDILRRAVKAAEPGGQADNLALRMAEAQFEAGDVKAAGSGFERLVETTADDELRGRALYGLLEAQRERGRDKEAEQTLARLESEYPELAATAGEGE